MSKDYSKKIKGWEKKLTDICMHEIFGEVYDNWNEGDVQEIDSMREYFISMFKNAPIETHRYIGMIVLANDGEIKLNRYKFRDGISPIVSLGYDDTYGTFARFEGYDICIGDEFFYLENVMTWDEMQELLGYLCGHGDDNKKSPYINSIYVSLYHQNQKRFEFEKPFKVSTIEDDKVTFIVVDALFIPSKDKVAVSYSATNENGEPTHSVRLLREIDHIGVKEIFDYFIEEFFKGDPNNQMIDL